MTHPCHDSFQDAIRAAQSLNTPKVYEFMSEVTALCAKCYKDGNKILIAGNGGSLCDADHFAEELTGQFREKRKALPAISLSHAGHMSCVANDMGFEEVFARGVEAFGVKGDLLFLLTTSGNSENLRRAALQAKKQGLTVISLLGKTGGVLKGLGDYELIIDGFKYSDRIQEAHMILIHSLIEQIENILFYDVSKQEEPALAHR
jgi:D-sedoheptulose 7-phosphate isomerase